MRLWVPVLTEDSSACGLSLRFWAAAPTPSDAHTSSAPPMSCCLAVVLANLSPLAFSRTRADGLTAKENTTEGFEAATYLRTTTTTGNSAADTLSAPDPILGHVFGSCPFPRSPSGITADRGP